MTPGSASDGLDRILMSDLRSFFGPNAGYVQELYERFTADPSSVSADDRAYFETAGPDLLTLPVAHSPRATSNGKPPASVVDVRSIVGAASLAQAVREYGHLRAN